MSGWQLGLALFGCWLAGVVSGLLLLSWYAHRRFRQQLAALPGQLLQTTATGRPIEPPPPR